MPGGLQEGPGSPVPSRTPRVAAPEGRGEISAKRAQIGPAASPMSSSLCSLCVIKPRGLCFVLQAVVLLSLMAFSARLRAAGIGFGDAAARAGCGHAAEPPAPHCPEGPLAGALCSVPAVLPPLPALVPSVSQPQPQARRHRDGHSSPSASHTQLCGRLVCQGLAGSSATCAETLMAFPTSLLLAPCKETLISLREKSAGVQGCGTQRPLV